MDTIWKKLQIKDQKRFLVRCMPPELESLRDSAESDWTIDREEPEHEGDYDLILQFVKSEEDIRAAADVLKHRADPDRTLVWIAYPKKSSKRYRVDISRDTGWDAVLNLGWEGVRQVSIADDWSAVRFRPRDRIKNYTRKKEIGRS